MMRLGDTIYIRRSALDFIKAESAQSAQEGLETGGYLFGEKIRRGITILFATGPGPNAIRTPIFVQPDQEHAKGEYLKCRGELRGRTGRDLQESGGWHLHNIDGVSDGDIRTMKEVSAAKPDYVHLVVCGFMKREVRAFTIENGEVTEKSLKVIEDQDAAVDFSRTEELLNHTILSRKTVLIFGVGSGGSEVAMLLAQAGVGHCILADPERLEKVNLVRHVGKSHQLGMYKADIVANEQCLVNPNIQVETIIDQLDARTVEGFKPFIKRAHVVVVCTGSPTDRLINAMCVELRKPVVFGGMFEKTTGGFALRHIPYHKNSPCLNCILDYTRHSISDSNEQLRDTAKRYGYSVEELAAQQGIYMDIKPVAALQAKMVLHTLLRPSQHNMPKLPAPLAIWNTAEWRAHWVLFKRRADCYDCNPEGWLEAQGKAVEQSMVMPSEAAE